jgi:hypothetical protein
MIQPFELVLFAAILKLCGGYGSRDPGAPGLVARIARRWFDFAMHLTPVMQSRGF